MFKKRLIQSFLFALGLHTVFFGLTPSPGKGKTGNSPMASDSSHALFINKGDSFYAYCNASAIKKSDYVRNIDSAIFYFKKAKTNFSERATLGLLKSYFFKGTYPDLPKKRKKEILALGKKIGTKGIKTYPKNGPMHIWYAICLGRWAQEFGAFRAAREGVVDKLKYLCERTIELGPAEARSDGYRIFGRIHHQAPRIPFFLSWPSNQEAIRLYKKALKIEPDNPTTLFFLGHVLVAEDRIVYGSPSG